MRTNRDLPPVLMCSQHRTGEHNEIHKHLPSLLKGQSVYGRFFHKDGRVRFSPQIELWSLGIRHDELAKTLNHNSPLTIDTDTDSILHKNYPDFFFEDQDTRYVFWRLWLICPHCRELMGKHADVSREYLGVSYAE